MKKNAGSHLLWLWTLTPLLLIGYGLYGADSWSRQPGTAPYFPNITTCVLAVFTLVSPFVQRRLVVKERDSITDEAMNNIKHTYNAGWILLITGGIYNVLVYLTVVMMSSFSGVGNG